MQAELLYSRQCVFWNW